MTLTDFELSQQVHFETRLKDFYTVDDKGCWVWRGRLNNSKPFITLNWNKTRVHFSVRRFYYCTANPNALVEKHEPIHATCGNPNCVNPNHLAIGYGAGTGKGATIAGVLKRYFILRNERNGKLTMKDACTELAINYATLKRYLTLYEKDPVKWQTIWENQ